MPVRTARDRRKRWGRPAFHHTPASVRWAKSTRLFFISLMDRAPALKGTSSSSKLFPVDRVTASKMSRSSRGNSSILRGGEAFRFLLPSTVSSSRPRPSRAASLFRIEPARYGKFMITKIDEDPVALAINRSGHALCRSDGAPFLLQAGALSVSQPPAPGSSGAAGNTLFRDKKRARPGHGHALTRSAKHGGLWGEEGIGRTVVMIAPPDVGALTLAKSAVRPSAASIRPHRQALR